jgi:hypothetical protein
VTPCKLPECVHFREYSPGDLALGHKKALEFCRYCQCFVGLDLYRPKQNSEGETPTGFNHGSARYTGTQKRRDHV